MLTGRLQMRLKPEIEKYINSRVVELGGTRSDYIMLLLQKDKEINVDDAQFWLSAVDAQLEQLNSIMSALKVIKNDLVK